jgi:hypothetical protein
MTQKIIKPVSYRNVHVDISLDNSVLIVFIDYGNSEVKLLNEIHPLQALFAYPPAMVVACTLAYVSVTL